MLHANIHSAMDMWLEGIRKVQTRRKEEIVNATNRHRNGGPRYQEEKGRWQHRSSSCVIRIRTSCSDSVCAYMSYIHLFGHV